MNPLNSVRGALTIGFVAAIILTLLIGPTAFGELSLARWLPILSGVMWIGLLYYFNVVQIPALATAAADKGGPGGAGITKYVAPRALLWFHWAALVTWFTGAWYLGSSGNLVGAFTLGVTGDVVNYYQLIIGLGAWMGTIMLFNVWALIWEQCEILRTIEPVKRILDIGRQANIALLGIGTLDPVTSRFIHFTALSAEEMREIIEGCGGVGEIGSFVYNIDGQPCGKEFADRVIGLNLDEIRRIPFRIGVAAWPRKPGLFTVHFEVAIYMS